MWPGFGSAWGATARSMLGRTGMGALMGAGIGGAYGAFSDNRSVLGGAIMGAGLGAGIARYGGAGLRRGILASRGIGVSAGQVGTYGSLGRAAALGMRNTAKRDWMKASLLARNAGSKIGRSGIRSNLGFNRFFGLGAGGV